MGSIPSILADLEFSRSLLLESIEGLSRRELTETPIYDRWTVKDVLAHILGWDQRVLHILPLILQDRAGDVPGVEVEEHNRRSVKAWRDKSPADLLHTFKTTYQQVLDIIARMDHIQVDLRHERNGRIITIRSYVFDVMLEHERQHALEIQHWRKGLEEAIDSEAIKETLRRERAEFAAWLESAAETDRLDKTMVGEWSLKDVVGHVADWEERMLKAAQHIFDPSLPPVLPVTGIDDIEDWNLVLAARRENDSWPAIYQFLGQVQVVTDTFVNQLNPGDWKLRGPYPWPNDRGTIAELIGHITEHYADHRLV